MQFNELQRTVRRQGSWNAPPTPAPLQGTVPPLFYGCQGRDKMLREVLGAGESQSREMEEDTRCNEELALGKE